MIVLGAWLAGRISTTPLAITAAAVLGTLGIGLLGGRVLAAGAATMVWGLGVAATVAVVIRLRTGPGIVAGVLGGTIAVQAAIIAFVILRFSAFAAPRDEAHLWLPAMLGVVRRLGGPVDERQEQPFWVQLSTDANVLPWLFLLLTGFVLAYVVRRGRGDRDPRLLAVRV
ncbi:MAG: hypothetical protein HKP61_10565 [Dactylosporangium sp.]|nr:hypothetical protein [Dactylosporangium sp.]NNJ61372.1 hypothetical protein [Dactylosporangium sp.]